MRHLLYLLSFTAKPLKKLPLFFLVTPSNPAQFSTHCGQASPEIASAKPTQDLLLPNPEATPQSSYSFLHIKYLIFKTSHWKDQDCGQSMLFLLASAFREA